MAIGGEPLLGPFGLRAKAPDGEPELLGMVRDCQMHGFMGNEIPQNEVWRHDEAPVEGKVSQRGTIAPLGALAHDQHLAALTSQSGDDGVEMT
jgi:hypothetical protein